MNENCDINEPRNRTKYLNDFNNSLSAYQVGSTFGPQNVWVNGQHFGIVTLTGSGPTVGITLSATEWLGTERARSDASNNLQATFCNLPFGDFLTTCQGTDPVPTANTHFTGQEHDTESGNDYFGARYYTSTMGRFLSPDDGSDQDPSNPQSWNLYSYVFNNPLTHTDPDGHDCVQLSNMTSQSVTVSVTEGGSADTCNGTFVNGTVNISSLTYNGQTGDVGYSFSNYANGSGSSGNGVIGQPSSSDSFPSGSLAAGLFGPQGGRYWSPASSVVNYLGNIEMTAIGMAMPELLGGAVPGAGLGSLAGKVRIVEQDGNVIRAVIQTPKGPVTIVANMVKEGDQLVLTGVHVDGEGLSISEIRQAARSLGSQEGASEVVIQGGVRTSGANPGSTPSQIRVKVQ